jgi:hypothetical protein
MDTTGALEVQILNLKLVKAQILMELCRITKSSIRLPRIVRFIIVEPSDMKLFQLTENFAECEDFINDNTKILENVDEYTITAGGVFWLTSNPGHK